MASKKVSFPGGFVQPQSESNLRLGEGVYSLSSKSNLPYVEFLGAGGYQKTISWGEVAEVPCGEMVTVRNASFHAGDLFINAGLEPYPMPQRITVPVRMTRQDGGEFGISFSRINEVDTRRARRAYLALEGSGDQTVNIYGVRIGSLDTENTIPSTERGTGYQQAQFLTGAEWAPIPLGYKAVMGDDGRPHVLLDKAYVVFPIFFLTNRPAYYVLEY